jgi:SAM-dependent methyltransferase
MIQSVDPHYFTETALRHWTQLGTKHRLRDQQFLHAIASWFAPGAILELGAATGHLSDILHGRGYDVTASDVSPRFVAAIAARGVPAEIVDATGDIRAQTARVFANILAQNVMPLIGRDRAVLLTTLNAIHAALEQKGRLICISAHAWRDRNPGAYFTPREQITIAEASGLFRLLKAVPHQVVPTSLYRSWNARALNLMDFQLAKIAAIRLAWVMEKID